MRTLLILLLAAVALFVWGFVFWGTPVSQSAVQHADNEEALGQALRDHLPGSGTYVIPNMYSEDTERAQAAHRTGPLATIHVQMDGAEPMNPWMFLMGFVHMFISVVFVYLLLKLALPALGTYGARVGFVLLAGLAAAFWINLSTPIWWYHPWNFPVMSFIYNVVGWLVAGLILGRFVRSPRTA